MLSWVQTHLLVNYQSQCVCFIYKRVFGGSERGGVTLQSECERERLSCSVQAAAEL